MLSCFPYFLNSSLFVCLLSSFFLPFFLPLVKRTINLVIFFSNFQGFTSVPWQKVGRISSNSLVFSFSSLFVCLLSCFPYFLKFSLFVCLLSLVFLLNFHFFFFDDRYVSKSIFSLKFINFSNFQGFTLLYWQKVGRIGLPFAPISLWNLFFPPLLSNERSIWHEYPIFFSNFHKSSPNWQEKVAISVNFWASSEIFTDLRSAFNSGSFEHLKTFVAWILGTRTFFLLTQFSKLQVFDFVKSIWKSNTYISHYQLN